MSATHLTTATRFIEVDGDRFAYRRWGKPCGVPLFFVPHFRGGMDHWDPLLTDGLAEGREVILFNGRGIASSSGTPRNRIEDLADDIAAVIRALGLPQVDLLGFSIGGLQVQEVALRHPGLVRKLLLLGTGLRGGDPTIDPRVLEVASTPVPTADAFLFLFFGRSDAAKQPASRFGSDAISESTRTRQVQPQSPRHRLKRMRPIWYRYPVKTPTPTWARSLSRRWS
jgi:pimeloyl-ACP methyl ester carboxylesterase